MTTTNRSKGRLLSMKESYIQNVAGGPHLRVLKSIEVGI